MTTILLDENLPAPLKKDFSDAFLVFTVYDKGWQSKKNGALLQAIDEEGIDFFTGTLNINSILQISIYALKLVL